MTPALNRKTQVLNLAESAAALLRGELVCYPTETFYALGCDARNPQAVARLRLAKGREGHKPLPCIVADMEQLLEIVPKLDAQARALTSAYWPGPLTLCLPAKKGLPAGVVNAAGEMAVRSPGHAIARELASLVGPLVSTSANLSGEAPARRAEALSPKVLQVAAGVLTEGEPPAGGAPSTIIRCLGDGNLELLREGAIAAEILTANGWQVHPYGEAGGIRN